MKSTETSNYFIHILSLDQENTMKPLEIKPSFYLRVKKKINPHSLIELRFPDEKRVPLLIIRLVNLVHLVALLTMHVRSVRDLTWEQSVTGGVLVTYCIATLGLSLCAGITTCGGIAFQTYLCFVGALLLICNAIVLFREWNKPQKRESFLKDILVVLGMTVPRGKLSKVLLSAISAILMISDIAILWTYTSEI